MLLFGYLLLGLVACTQNPRQDPDIEKMAIILEEMIQANKALVPEDSLKARREALFEKHSTNEAEVRAWISTISQDVSTSHELANRLSAALESKSDTKKPPSYQEPK
jgi:hypothetical protein